MSNEKRSSATIIGYVDAVSGPNTRGKFTYRETRITEGPGAKYPNPIVVEWSGDNMDKAADLQVGDAVTIACNVRGREWKSPSGEVKFFLSMAGWKVEAHDKSGRVPMGDGGYSGPPPAGPEDDLPFAVCSIDAEPSPIAPALRRNV